VGNERESDQAGKPAPEPQPKIKDLAELRKGAEGIIIEPGPASENPFQEFAPPEAQEPPQQNPPSQSVAPPQTAPEAAAPPAEQGGDS